jgi:hypothetical protein
VKLLDPVFENLVVVHDRPRRFGALWREFIHQFGDNEACAAPVARQLDRPNVNKSSNQAFP